MTATSQQNLFDKDPATQSIPGLEYIDSYINKEYENRLIQIIDKQPWITDLKRRVQHYGYRYDYKAKSISPSTKLEELPGLLLELCQDLQKTLVFCKVPDQVIINEYLPGQGISPHIDSANNFGDTIASLSLGSECIMLFSNDSQKIPILLSPRSLIVMKGEARFNWQHSIPSRKTDIYDGFKFSRKRRISLTFRNVNS